MTKENYINGLYFDLASLQENLRENKEHSDSNLLEKIKDIEQELSNIESDPGYEPWNLSDEDLKQDRRDHYSNDY